MSIDEAYRLKVCANVNAEISEGVLLKRVATALKGARRCEAFASTRRFTVTAVEAACAEALRETTHSADVVINILARHREPAPPVTILTPDALRLTHAPIADCARYDSFRRPI